MRVFLAGVACVGKSTVGAKAAALLDYTFSDLDKEIESHFSTSIERLQQRYWTAYSYRKEASKALAHVLAHKAGQGAIIALPPSGLLDRFWNVVKRAPGLIAVLSDDPMNILNRLVFYDVNSRPIPKRPNEEERRRYLRLIEADIKYYRRSYRRAHLSLNIAGSGADDAARRLAAMIPTALERLKP